MKMVLIPPGEFLMGTSDAEIAAATKQAEAAATHNQAQPYREFINQGPQHPVRLSRAFRLAECETTVGQFRKFTDATGYVTEAEADGKPNPGLRPVAEGEFESIEGDYSWRNPGWKQSDLEPVVQTTWNDAVTFCNWLSAAEGLSPAYVKDIHGRWVRIVDAPGYRLPTEAEWEYACRAGTTSGWWWGDDSTQHRSFEFVSGQHGEVGRRTPNPFGLYDMAGNVSEWCQDFFGTYPTSQLEIDPEWTTSDARRVLRGGSFRSQAVMARSARRTGVIAPNPGQGFRVARSMAAGPSDRAAAP
jgi:formylglycine-generating enzyme required for sulfatase activity